MNLRLLSFVLLLCAAYASGSTLAGEIHKWVDENGVVHYGDKVPDDVKSDKVQVRTGQSASATAATPRAIATNSSSIQGAGNAAIHNDGQEQANVVADRKACEDTALQLAILEASLPTYRDNKGRFHNTARWLYDPYKGQRTYLDEQARQNEIARKKSEVRSQCAFLRLSDEGLRAFRQELWERLEKCKTATGQLEEAQDASLGRTEKFAEDARRQVNAYCRS